VELVVRIASRLPVASVALFALTIAPAVSAQEPASPAPAPAPAPRPAPRAAAPANPVTAAPTPPAPDSGVIRREDRGRDVPWKPFGEITKNAQVVSGLFTAYVKRDVTYIGIKPSQFDRDFLLVTQLSQGIGEVGLDAGASLRSDLVRFHRSGDRIELWVVNPHVAAAPGTPMALTVDASFGHSVAYSFPIATMRDTSEILVDLDPLLVSDWADVGGSLQALANRRRVGGSVLFDRDRSSLQSLRVFPANLEAEARLTFAPTRNLGLETVADYRWIPLGVHYSLLELPATPMRPRYADDRVGYFVSAIKDFSRDTADGFFVRYVNRWRLEKKDPAARVSEPVRPIVYYIDRTVPLEWRSYVRAGILEWNRAFEEAGFRNAIRVLDAPADTSWSAEDARWSTVRWTATNRAVYAIGPSNVDPRSGEIINADILISAQWIQTWRGEAERMGGPQAFVNQVFGQDSLLAQLPATQAGRLCAYTSALPLQGTLLRAALANLGLIAPGAALPKEFVGQALKELVMHEVGHTLGLRHTFRGSAGITREQLADREYTAQHGIGVSVMDYDPPAVASPRGQQGDYYAGTIGSYDRWAIQYGYAPVRADQHAPAKGGGAEAGESWTPDLELNALRALAARASEPGNMYASDEDAGFGSFGIDPTVSRYDQTDDPLGWARDRVGLIDSMFDSLETRIVASGEAYPRLRNAFTDLLSARWYATLVASKYVGGVITSRDHRDDPGARPPFVNVPAAKQREALAFVTQAGFGEGAYRFRPELLSRLAPERWMHWGSNPVGDRIDFPLHEWALSQETGLLNQLLDPSVLARLRDAELRAADEKSVLSIPDLFDALTSAIWAEAGYRPDGRAPRAPRNTGSVRRDVQRLYLANLIRLVVNPLPDTPEDARAIARQTLTELGTTIDRALARPGVQLDAYTRAHLADSRDRIDQALAAELIQQPGLAR
jgi:hypothetical protein